jgi:serine/threonine-protein kinase RsbW
VDINLALVLPRDSTTLPLVRHLCKHCLWEIGVSRQCASDVELAVTEACTNVVKHSSGDDAYEVKIAITDNDCEIRVIDTGHGFDHASLGTDDAELTAESGRGIQLMRALVDNILFTSEPESGTVVHLVKALEFDKEPPPYITRDHTRTD